MLLPISLSSPLPSPLIPRASKAWLRELGQVNCTSFFRAARAPRGAYRSPLPLPPIPRAIDFSGKKSVENSIMRFQSERASERTYLLPAHYAKIPSTDALTPKMSIYLFSAENLMARVKSDYYCVSYKISRTSRVALNYIRAPSQENSRLKLSIVLVC